MRKKSHILLLISSLILISVTLTPSCKNEVQKKEPKTPVKKEWKVLFDGTDASAWRGFKNESMPAGWTVKDSVLITSGEGGDLGGDIITREQFEDFKLSLEWKISEGGNSGVFFGVVEGDQHAVYASGPEYQLIDDIGFEYPLEPWQKTAANYAMHFADSAAAVLKPVGEWNHSGIRVKDGKVVHWLNGKKVVEYQLWDEDWKASVADSKWKDYPAYGLAIKGHIGLQDHGSPIEFRNIKIKDLTDLGSPIFNGKNLKGWTIYGTEKWYAKDGELVCESGEDKAYGYLGTDKPYKDFIMHLKFLQESDGNSGVFFRSQIEGTKISGWQVEVAPPGNNTGGIYESYGRGWLNEIPEEKEGILKPGEWNEMVIRVEGSRVMTWLNGQLMTDLKDEKIGAANGSIALQIHDGGGIKVRWKDLYVRELNNNSNEVH